jgi:hypothetical protein
MGRELMKAGGRGGQASFNNMIGAAELGERKGDAERLRGFEVDDQLDLGDLLHRQVGGFFALENAAGVDANAAMGIEIVGSVAHKTAHINELAVCIDGRHGVASRQRDQPLTLGQKEILAADHECARPLADKRREGRVNLTGTTCIEHEDARSKRTCRSLHGLSFGLGLQFIGRVEQDRNRGGRRHQVVHQLQALCDQFNVEDRDAGDVAVRPVHAGDETNLDRVGTDQKNDWDGLGRCLGGKRSRRAASYGDNVHPAAHKFGRQCRQSVVMAFRPPVVDGNILTLDVARIGQASMKCGDVVVHDFTCCSAEITDRRHCRLRVRNQRPRNRRAAEKGYEIAPSHDCLAVGTSGNSHVQVKCRQRAACGSRVRRR